MGKLADIQRQFTQYLLEKDVPAKFLSEIFSDQLSAKKRYQVYQDSSEAILVKALREIYPVCVALVGDEFFNQMAKLYLRDYPSTSADLNNYGEYLSDFLQRFPPTQELPYYPDVAKLEWCWHRVFYKSVSVEINMEDINDYSDEDQEQLITQFTQNSYHLESDYPIDQIWLVNQQYFEGDQVVNLDEGGVSLLLYKNQDGRQMKKLSKKQGKNWRQWMIDDNKEIQ